MLPVRVSCGSIVLRPFTLADAPRVTELCADAAIAEMTGAIPHPYTHAMAEEWIAALPHPTTLATDYDYAVVRREDDVLIGAVGLDARPEATDNLGYWIGRPYWGRGHATDAATAMIALGFSCLDLIEMHASHLERNPASGRVMAKCGMREMRREVRAHRAGEPERFCLWSIDRDEWRAWIER